MSIQGKEGGIQNNLYIYDRELGECGAIYQDMEQKNRLSKEDAVFHFAHAHLRCCETRE